MELIFTSKVEAISMLSGDLSKGTPHAFWEESAVAVVGQCFFTLEVNKQARQGWWGKLVPAVAPLQLPFRWCLGFIKR